MRIFNTIFVFILYFLEVFDALFLWFDDASLFAILDFELVDLFFLSLNLFDQPINSFADAICL